MNKIKLLTVTGLFIIATSLLTPTAVNASLFGSGTKCEAANLNQALAGIGWSQAGVRNNATTPFFVVCPMDWDYFSPTTNLAHVLATFPGNTGAVDCIARAQLLSGAYTSASFTVNAGNGGIGADRGVDAKSIDFSGALNGTVVCALDPGEGIEAVWPGFDPCATCH